ncbi:hypothetical protein WG899_19710 [Paucibacter sp. AS339]|uniref:hypothetical protein n=1 Tax=Paucibacter hankyongi TaxID=3133434 RepID=UPI00309E35B2
MHSNRPAGKAAGACSGVLALLLSCQSAWALEFGSVQSLAGLGQPLSLQLPVRFNPGEARRADCLKVRLDAGERNLSDGEIEQGWVKAKGANKRDEQAGLIWIRSRAEMAEPVLRLSIGCPQQHLAVFVDPVSLLPPPAAGVATKIEAQALPEVAPAKSAPRAIKVRAERPSGPVLRMDDPGLPPLSLPDAEVPGLRFRFDSDLAPTMTARPLPVSGREPKPRAERRISLLMAIDVGRALGPAEMLTLDAGQGSSSAPARLVRAQQQFDALQADQRALRSEMDQLLADMEQRRQASVRTWRLAAIVALGLAVLGAGLFFMSKRRRKPRATAA